MNLSERGRKMIEDFEGRKNKPYKCPAGAMTIGIGHALTKAELDSGAIAIDGASVAWKNGLTSAQVDALFDQDVEPFERLINTTTHRAINQNQFDALVSFAFNIGAYAYRHSTALRKLNSYDRSEVPAEMRRWDKAGGKKIAGLTERRKQESELFSA